MCVGLGMCERGLVWLWMRVFKGVIVSGCRHTCVRARGRVKVTKKELDSVGDADGDGEESSSVQFKGKIDQ